MPRDVSPSSSEDESDRSTGEASLRQKKPGTRTSRYKCPDDFVSFRHKPCSSTLTDSLKTSNSELWLIKTPASFNPECLQGVYVRLSGLQTLRFPSAVDGGKSKRGQQIYNVLGSTHGTSELHLLTGDVASSRATVMGPPFAGLLSVSESYGAARQPPQIIPGSPAPSIPPGLKQRYHPFGSKTPTQGAGSEVDGAPLLEVTQVSDGEGRKRKKKKLKKEKHIKTEQEDEEMTVKQEGRADILFQEERPLEEKRRKKRKKVRDEEESPPPGAVVTVKQEVGEDILFQEGEAPEEKSRKKRNKKDREAQEQSPPAAEVVFKQEVKSERADILHDQQDGGSLKKKKKKKKSKSDD